jgi:hypothetical protein
MRRRFAARSSARSSARSCLAWACLLVLVPLGGLTAAVAAAPTKARARAFAAAVNLTAADLPGFTGSVAHSTPADKSRGVTLARCAGGVDPRRALVNIDSRNFKAMGSGGIAAEEVGSNVGVLPSSALAARDLAAVRSARGRRCLAAAVNQLLHAMNAKGVSYGRAVLSTLPHPAPGADGSFGLRIKVTSDVHGLRIPFWVDEFGVRVGPAEVSLNALGVLHPFAAADEQRLFALLVARATAARL